MSRQFFVLEVLAVLFPAVACMVWPQLTVTLVVSMAITSESAALVRFAYGRKIKWFSDQSLN